MRFWSGCSSPPSGLQVNAGSPAIDTGAIVTDVYDLFETRYSRSIRVDKDGTVRPVNSLYDAGAYEQ